MEAVELEQAALERLVPRNPLLPAKPRRGRRQTITQLGREEKSGVGFWFVASVLLNLAFSAAVMLGKSNNTEVKKMDKSQANGTATVLKSSVEEKPLASQCNACFRGKDCSDAEHTCVINLDHGDPKMYEAHWQQRGEESTVTILGWQKMSYFAHFQHFFFVEKDLVEQIRALHKVVGNAVTEGRHIVVGAGSTQLLQAALYALSPDDGPAISVISSVPYYSCYQSIATMFKSRLYQWQGDAATFLEASPGEPYIQMVASPNNPDGSMTHDILKGSGAGNSGKAIFDLAYFWPQYTPISAPADHDVMLFTLSKATGHAGTRIGWAIVKDEALARKLATYIEVGSIGVSQDSQVRATQILKVVTKHAAKQRGHPAVQVNSVEKLHDVDFLQKQDMFGFASSVMSYRWSRLREALQGSKRFRMPQYTPENCTFFGRVTSPAPAFLWLECLVEENCWQVLKDANIVSRSGSLFGADLKFARISMVDRSEGFEIFVDRLARLSHELD